MNENRQTAGLEVRQRPLIFAVSLVASSLAFAGAWLRPVWHDELYTLAVARLPIKELISALVVDSGPPLHYLICHGLFLLVGWQESSMLGTFLVRLPSVLAFALLPWVVWRARPVAHRNLPWGPLLVIAWLPLLYFGTEARAYALLALVHAVLWIRGPDWLERGGRRTFQFAVLAACLPLLHYTGLVGFFALPMIAVFISRARRRTLLLALAAAVVPTLIWLPVPLGAPRASMGWLSTVAGPGRPGFSTLTALAPAGPFPALFEASARPVSTWLSVSILGALVCSSIVGLLRLCRAPNANDRDARCAVRLAMGLTPVLALATLALVGVPVYFAGRTEAMVWPLGAALTAVLVSGLRAVERWAVVGGYVAVGGLTVAMWLADLPARPPAPGVEVGLELAKSLEDSDRVVVVGLWQLEVRHGLRRGSRGVPASAAATVDVETIPSSQSDHPGWLDREAATSPKLIDHARKLERSAFLEGRRVWVVWSPALPLENTFFPAFAGWSRQRAADSPIIVVDLLTAWQDTVRQRVVGSGAHSPR